MMIESTPVESGKLMSEVASYLAAVDAFRALGREPEWRLEPSSTRTRERAVFRSTDGRTTIRERRLGPPRFTV